MKKLFIALALVGLSLSASAQLAYPGSNWSDVTVNPSVVKGTPEANNVLLQGNIEQGIVWKHFGAWRLNTFTGLNYSVDRNGLAYNNKLAPMVGVKFQHDFSSNGQLDLGVRLVHERHFRSVTEGENSGTGVQAYADYWFGWNLGK